MELRFIKPSFKYKAGQWLFLNCPEVSKFQWHPVRLCPALYPASSTDEENSSSQSPRHQRTRSCRYTSDKLAISPMPLVQDSVLSGVLLGAS
jgi:hypothetical protein